MAIAVDKLPSPFATLAATFRNRRPSRIGITRTCCVLTRPSPAGARVTLLHVHPMTVVAVLDYTYAEPPELVAEAVEAISVRLKSWADDLTTPAEMIETAVKTGQPAHEIITAAADYDMVVMGTHGRTGVSRFLMGSVAERVVQGAPCSVLVFRPSADDATE